VSDARVLDITKYYSDISFFRSRVCQSGKFEAESIALVTDSVRGPSLTDPEIATLAVESGARALAVQLEMALYETLNPAPRLQDSVLAHRRRTTEEQGTIMA
jgi:hypothetical protein